MSLVKRAGWLALLALCGCDESKSAPSPARVVAVAAQPSVANESEFCDVRFAGGDAPKFALPPVEGPTELQRASKGALWINVWASWCAPCTEELPLLRRWSADFAREGLGASLLLLSIDSSEQAVQTFARAHPEAANTLRLSESAALEPWLKSIGLGANATLPVHVFVNAQGRVSCTRTGAVRESDLPSIRKLLSG
jgi:thiol-disulfide isomerase/thioredoxin